MAGSSRRSFIAQSAAAAALLAAGLAGGSRARAQAGRRPNILFIMSDDHAAQAIGAYGSQVNETPHIDRLAAEGVRADRIYATNAICTPSRATILTGQYSHMNGVPVFNALEDDRPVVSTALQQAGYWTSMTGKWHLGNAPRGFDHWEILPGQGAYLNPRLYNAQGTATYQGHCTDVVTDIALEALAGRPKDQPFFAMVHHKAPHRNWVPAERHRAAWAGRVVPEPETLFDSYATRSDALRANKQSIARDLNANDTKGEPPAGLVGAERTRWMYQRYMQDYLACVQGVDESVGRLLDWLDAEGLADDTLVIYTSDQGFFLGEKGMYDKRFFYEESARMPFLARWPGSLPAGGLCEALGINVDFAPTFLAAAGAPAPAWMQGRSLLEPLAGRRPADWRRSFYYRYYHDPGDHNTAAHYGLRTESHKVIYYHTLDQWECFDLIRDPHEQRNLVGLSEHRALVANLRAQLAAAKIAVGDTEDRYARREDWPKTSSAGKAPPPR